MPSTAVKHDPAIAAYAVETYDDVIDEIKPLLDLHYEEIAYWKGDIPLDPDFKVYKALSDAGVLKIYTARMGGDLIGYGIYVLRSVHPHYQTTSWLISDILFVEPRHRNWGVGSGLVGFIEQEARAIGVDVLMTGTKQGHPALGALLSAMGHEPIDLIYGKRLT